jgi:hypothetical protein
MQRIWNDRSFGSNHVNFLLLAATLAVIAGAVVAAAAAGAWRARRASLGPLAAVALTVALWAWSVPWTAGGVNYSLRVLTPAAALCAVLGACLGATRPGFGRAAILAAVLGLSADAARRSWLLPIFPRAPVIPWSFDDWRAVQTDLRRLDENPLWDYLHRAADGGLVAVDNPNAYVALTRRGGRAAMLFSPVFAGCFDPAPKFEDTVQRLREARVRLIVLSVGDRVALSFIKAHPFFETLRSGFRPLVAVQTVAVYDLDTLRPSGP